MVVAAALLALGTGKCLTSVASRRTCGDRPFSAPYTYHMCMDRSAHLRRAASRLATTRFKPGNWWVWLYRDSSGVPSSWERYAVRACEGDELIIEMSSRFDAGDQHEAHHRLRVSLSESLGAADDSNQWCLSDFSFCQDSVWRKAPHRDNVQAFEEKFDCFLMGSRPLPVSVCAQRTKDVVAFGRTSLVQTKRHKSTDAWYVMEPRAHAGLAAYKIFGREGGPDTFTFELIALGNADSTDDLGAMGTSERSAFG